MSLAYKVDPKTSLYQLVDTQTGEVLGQHQLARDAARIARMHNRISQDQYDEIRLASVVAQNKFNELSNNPDLTVTTADLDPANRQTPPANTEQAQGSRAAATASQTADFASIDAGSLSPEEVQRTDAATSGNPEESILGGVPVPYTQNNQSILGGLTRDQFADRAQEGLLGGKAITSPNDDSILGGLSPGEFKERFSVEEKKSTEEKNSSDAAETKKTIVVSGSTDRVIDKSKPRPNPLDNYASYIYSISLHVIPIEKYNTMVKTPGYQYKNSDDTVLIASGGRRDQTNFKRHPLFNEDFYFENLKFNTVIGLNSRTRGTNAVEVNFSITEPYGVTLLNRLLGIAKEFKTKSWMQIPFLIQIDFLGNDDLGQLYTPIPNQTKYIPIKLIGLKIKVTSKGAEYQVQAVPFGHQAYMETYSSTPAFLEVQAKTVGDFFSSGGDAGEATSIADFKKIAKERTESAIKSARDDEDLYGVRQSERINTAKEVAAEAAKMSYVVGSYAAALNSFQEQLKKNKHITREEIFEFVFTDPAMRDSKIVIPKKTAAPRTPMAKPTTAEGLAAIRAAAGLSTAKLDTTTESFTINAGTNIIEVINMVMRHSEYIRNQFKDPAVEISTSGQENANKSNEPIKWYKIQPVVELLDFDYRTDKYSKKITYYIEPYLIYNSKFRDAPKSLPNYYSKEYQYIYTGKNTSIIDFNIDFDTMFYTAITADRSKTQKTSGPQAQPEQDQTHDATDKTHQAKLQDNVTQPVAGQADQVEPASPDSKGTLLNDFSKSIMSSSRGDMITVNLKIIGDPELIKQDDVFVNPANNPNQGNKEFIDPKTNSLIFDAGEVFALLKFKTPVDYDDETGLMKFQSYQTSVFSGLYKIIMVDNEFSQGKFTQTLQLVRMFNQPDYDTLDGKGTANDKVIENRSREVKTPAETLTSDAAGAAYGQLDEVENQNQSYDSEDDDRRDFAEVNIEIPESDDFNNQAQFDADILGDIDIREGLDPLVDIPDIEIDDGTYENGITGADDPNFDYDQQGLGQANITGGLAEISTSLPDNIVENQSLIQRLKNQLRTAPTSTLNNNSFVNTGL